MPLFVELLFPLPFRKAFTYKVPEDLVDAVQIGVRAVAPFGKRVITGFIINTLEKVESDFEIKEIQDIIDSIPIVAGNDFNFYEWLAEYYLCSTGEALKLAVPQGTDIQSKKRITADTVYCTKLFHEEKRKDSIRGRLLHVLIDHPSISISRLQKEINKKNIYGPLRTLERDGAISIHDEPEKPKVQAKRLTFVKLAKPVEEVYDAIPELERRASKQVAVLLKLISSKDKEIPLNEFLENNGFNLSSVSSLVKRGLVKTFPKEIERKHISLYSEEHVELKPTAGQQSVIDEVTPVLSAGDFKVYLLHGVTGSGKTQVYIELVKKTLALGKTAIILVPEISLTPQITTRLFNNFGDTVALIHSKMSPGERFDSWQKILKGKAKVVVGARSALFSPMKNIGLIVVDEEHDSSYKQDESPKYQARDAAIIKAKFSGCPIILGSATPSVESMFNVHLKKFSLLKLPERIDDAKLPRITLVNVIEEKKRKRMENIFSQTLLEKIDDRLKKKEGVIILQNRRGFATQLYCVDCGELETCNNCSVSMVYHINQNLLQCHYCGFTRKVPEACSNCGSKQLKYFGTGTERVEDELAYYFPNTSISRVDSDSISKKGSLGEILAKFKSGETDILVGTQMVAKGLDFSRVTLVGVVSAETSLWLPDFRADERTFQLLTQVSGRAGRSKVEGEVLIQAQNHKHFALQKVLENDYDGFYKKEIADRERMGYPPFTRLCLIEMKDKDHGKVKRGITDFYNELLAYKKYVKITPPSTAIIARLKGEYRYQVLIKSNRSEDPGGAVLRTAVTSAEAEFKKKSSIRDIPVSIDIDPQSII